MGYPTKEESVINLFFNEPTKHWRFEEIRRTIKITKHRANYWLKRLQKEGIIKRIKIRGKMPYYIGDYGNPHYQNSKRLFALKQFYHSGFLDYLSSLNNVKTIILFGSMVRWDWHKNSDIDLFIYGGAKVLTLGKYEKLFNREIQVFECSSIDDLNKLGEGLIRNIIKGDIIKGNIDFIKVVLNA